jgi:hypothetical protein
MSRTALFCAAALIATAFAVPALGAPTATPSAAAFTPPVIDLSASPLNHPITASNGATVDPAPFLADADLIANGVLGAASKATATAGSGQSTATNTSMNSEVPFAGAAPVSGSGLGGTRGGTDITFNGAMTNQDLNAVNTGNTINAAALTNGPVTIGTNAFSGFNGVGNFIMNTGNQNNIQGTLSVSVLIPASLPH